MQVTCPKEVVKVVEQVSRKEQARQLYESGDISALKAFKKAAKVSWEKLGIPDPDKVPPVPMAKPKTEAKKINVSELTKATHGEGSLRERIQKLLAIGLTSVGVAKAVLELKKKSKKSWGVLGVPPDQVLQITKLADKG